MEGRRDIFTPLFKDDRSGYYVLTVGPHPFGPLVSSRTSSCIGNRRRVAPSLTSPPMMVSVDDATSSSPSYTTSRKRALSDIATASSPGVQNPQLALTDALENTDAGNSAVQTLLN